MYSNLANKNNYFMYVPMVEKGTVDIYSSDITADTYQEYFLGIMNILRDGIETDEVQSMFIRLHYEDNQVLELNIIDFFFNLIMWRGFIDINISIQPHMLFFPKHITQDTIKNFLDTVFLYKNRDEINILKNRGYDPEVSIIILNRCIDNVSYGFSFIDEFSFYLLNTINIKDDIDLQQANPRFREILHTDLLSLDVPFEQINNACMDLTREAIDIISNSNHCLADCFRAEEGINPKQYREYLIGKGTIPDGQGSAFPIVINSSFINRGVNTLEYTFAESASGRLAQIIAKCNVGTSGAFARILGLNNRDSFLHNDPNYICNSRNFERITIIDKSYLYNFEGRYYRENPWGIEKYLKIDDYHLIGKTLYFRSPMKCSSASHGNGICYRCYGKLAYTNASINIGQFAAENLSAKLTQKQLSAKHILESAIVALVWNEHFDKLFDVFYNTVKIKEGIDMEQYSIILIPSEIQLESEDDDFVFNEYISTITIEDNYTKDRYQIYTEAFDNLYISEDLNATIRRLSKAAIEDNYIRIPVKEISTEEPLFLIRLTNNEFSATLNRVSSLLNLDEATTAYNSHDLLQELNIACIKGKLNITSIHLEVILMNQLRCKDNILDTPEWDNEDEEYQVLTLNRALSNNPSICISLMYQITNAYYNPLSFRKSKPSYLDLLFMEKPQEYFVNEHFYNKTDKTKPVPHKVNLVRRIPTND